MYKKLIIFSLIFSGAFGLSFAAVENTEKVTRSEKSRNHQLYISKRVATSEKVKVSPKVRDIIRTLSPLTPSRQQKMRVSGEPIPGVDKIREVPNRFPFRNRKNSAQEPKILDKALQNSLPTYPYSSQSRNADITKSFDGIGNVLGVAPPDTNGDVGPNHYVQTVNVAMAVYDKKGNTLVPPFAINQLWRGFGGKCETNNNGDPIVLYDVMADRWLVSQFALGGNDYRQCIAISTTGDPTGSYYLYDFPYGTLFNDYPKLGVWHNGYYMGVNQFDPLDGFNFAGGGVVAYERDKMLQGAEARQVIFSLQGSTPTVFTPMPLDIDGINPPSSDLAQLFIWADADLTRGGKLHIGRFSVDWNNLSRASFSIVKPLDVAQWNIPDNPVQPNGGALDSVAIRSMFRAAYRNLGSRSAIVFNHTVAGTDGSTPAVRWYELDLNETSAEVSVRQQGTFSPDNKARWMGSGAMDAQGNIAVGYSLASKNTFPSIYAATRLVSEPLGILGTEFKLKAGEGSQGGVDRWGDYSSMSIDPSDDCSFWYTNQYYKDENDDTANWSTNISNFKIPSCVAKPSGYISGTVSDASTGEVIAGANVRAGARVTKTDIKGSYKLQLPVGTYNVAVSRYGWSDASRAGVNVQAGKTEVINFTLTSAQMRTITGNVKDGAAQGWSLYADVKVEVPGGVIPVRTNPETGDYSVSLVAGVPVKFKVSSVTDGYLPTEKNVTPTVRTSEENFALSLNPNCTALGYAFDSPGFIEQFEGAFPPTGWSLASTSTINWMSSASSTLGNITGTSGNTALVDSDEAGFVDVDASMITPTFQVGKLKNPILSFVANHRTASGKDKLDLDIKVDSGAWQRVETMKSGPSVLGGVASYHIDLSKFLSGATGFKLRWRYYDASFEWYAAVDNVVMGTPNCLPVAGSLVSGYVRDANTGQAVNNALLTAGTKELGYSVTTEQDPALKDGFLYAFIPANAKDLKLVAARYQTKSVKKEDFTLATPVNLNAGVLEASDAIELSVTQGRTTKGKLDIRNIGTAGANYRLITFPFAVKPLKLGPFDSKGRHFGPKNLNDKNTRKIRYFRAIEAKELDGIRFVKRFNLATGSSGWGIGINRPTKDFWVGDTASKGSSKGRLVEYSSKGVTTGRIIETKFISTFGADLAYNGRTGMLWQVNVGGDNCIYEIDPTSMSVTGKKICPKFGNSQRGLAYDPITDTFYSGSWDDSIIHQFNVDGKMIRSVNVNLSIAGLALNPSNGHLYVTNNAFSEGQGVFDVYLLDAKTSTLPVIGGFNIHLDSDADGRHDLTLDDQAGLDIDCDGNLWAVDQSQQIVIGFNTGEKGVCDWEVVPWLTTDKNSGMLPISGKDSIAVMADSSALTVGVKQATISIVSDTPYPPVNVPVTLTVEQPSFGRLSFVETQVTVKNGETAELYVRRSDGDDFPVSVKYSIVEGSAKPNEHFELITGTLNWGDMDKDDKVIRVNTKDVNLDDPVSFTLILEQPQRATLGTNKIAVVTITEDRLGKISMSVSNVEVDEEKGSVNVTVVRTDGSERAISVKYSITQAGTVIATGTITWGDGDKKAKVIKLDIPSSDASENKVFNVLLTSSDEPVEFGQRLTEVVVMAGDDITETVRRDVGGSLGVTSLILLLLYGVRRRYLYH